MQLEGIFKTITKAINFRNSEEFCLLRRSAIPQKLLVTIMDNFVLLTEDIKYLLWFLDVEGM